MTGMGGCTQGAFVRNLVPERKHMGPSQPECCYDTVQDSGNTHHASNQHIRHGWYQEWAQVGRRSIRAVGANSTSSCLASRGTRRQLGVWLLLLLDEGRAAAPQLRDHEFWSEALQLPTLNKLDAVLKTYKGECRRDARLHQQRRRGSGSLAFSWPSSHGRKGHCRWHTPWCCGLKRRGIIA